MAKDTAAIIVAGGQGLRFGGKVRKQYLLLAGRPILWWSLKAFEKSPSVASVILVVPERDVPLMKRKARNWKFKKLLSVVSGGTTRADSVWQGLQAVSPSVKWVAVHDAVRPLVTAALIEEVLRQARRYQAAIAACPSKDTVKISDVQGRIQSSPARETVWLAQTPQAFNRRLLHRAHHAGRKLQVTDDAQLVERLGVKVKLVASPAENLKVTHPVDLVLAKKYYGEKIMSSMRVGIGYDIHRLVKGRALWLGGIKIPFDRGLEGHSDADALLHAIIDALLGAAALPDIGHYFPSTDPAIKNIASSLMMTKTMDEVERMGYRVVNVDSILIAEEPKMAPHRPAICQNIARLLKIPVSAVQMKGKTHEELDSIGKKQAIAAQAVVLLESTVV